MLLINFEINITLTWSTNCVICEADRATTFAITDTKLCVQVATFSTHGNTKKLLQQLKSGFKSTINWNKYLLKQSTQTQNQYLDYLINPRF